MSKVGDDIRGELIAIVNYGIIGLIQIELGESMCDDISADKALELYRKYIEEAKKLMQIKNHDYDEAWRLMRHNPTDLILQKYIAPSKLKIIRKTLISEGVDANYFDMINYAVFGLIKTEFEN